MCRPLASDFSKSVQIEQVPTYLIILSKPYFFLVSASSQRLIHVLHNSEQPASCFSVLDTGTTLIADVLFDVLIHKLTSGKAGKESFYQQRKGSKMESKGPRYELSDFIIKIGSVSMASNFKGILVEVSIIFISAYNSFLAFLKKNIESYQIMGAIAFYSHILTIEINAKVHYEFESHSGPDRLFMRGSLPASLKR